jgi:GTP:adenosylcobinamide-phosphate guanylyltransferase
MASKTTFFFYFAGGEKDSTVSIKHKKYSKIDARVENVVEFNSYSSWFQPTTFEIKNNSSNSIVFIGVNYFVEGISTKKLLLKILSKKINGNHITDLSNATTLNPGDELILRCKGYILTIS